MLTLRLTGRVDEHHRLSADVPGSVAVGSVEVLIMLPETTDDGAADYWERGVAAEWADELADAGQDIYTVSDGEPVDEAR